MGKFTVRSNTQFGLPIQEADRYFLVDRIADIITVEDLLAMEQVVQEAQKVVKQHGIRARALGRLPG